MVKHRCIDISCSTISSFNSNQKQKRNGYIQAHYIRILLTKRRIILSRKSRERREKHKSVKPDDFYSNGEFEILRFGENIIIKNNRTPTQQATRMDNLFKEYPSMYKHIEDCILSVREKILRCNPYNLLMYLRMIAFHLQMNILSEFDFSSEANSILRGQEYVQSIIISSDLNIDYSMSKDDEKKLFSQITTELNEIYKELQIFYHYWAAHIQKTTDISKERLNEIVEAQYMYLVRGNRYQVFELEPIKSLLSPHDEVLLRLFGISVDEIVAGLEKLRYSLSQGYADALMQLCDRYEEIQNAGDSENLIKNAKERITKTADKVLGRDLIDVKKVTGWNEKFIDLLSSSIGECNDFWGDGEFSGWPIVSLPVSKKPFIKLDGVSYAFLYYALFDNVYRIIQKGIMQQEKEYQDIWKEKQTQASEEMVCNLFLQLLPGAESHMKNYYPVKKSVKQMNENDILIIYYGHLFIIEVKAGSFPSTPPITDFNAHIDAYHNLAEVADSQCSRTVEYIKKHELAQFYDHEKNLTFQIPNYSSFDDVFTFAVTVDSFNEFAAKAEKQSVISLKEETIVISIDDLLVYSGYFDSPTQFLHYLKQRKLAMYVPQFQMSDELDHLGLYIDRNLYASTPLEYGDVKNVMFQGFRKPIDEYFNWLYAEPTNAKKPKQNIPKVVSDIIKYLDCNISLENIIFAHFLLDMSIDAKESFSALVLNSLKRQHELHHQDPLVVLGDISYCMFVSIPGIKVYSSQEKIDYVYTIVSRNDSIPVMMVSLEYDINNCLTSAKGIKCSFSNLKGKDKERQILD